MFLDNPVHEVFHDVLGAENVSDSSRVALVELARKEELKRILTQAFGI